MTDPIDHELLSRVLDDEATSEERAQVAADLVLAAQLEDLRRTQRRLAVPPAPLEPHAVDAMVAAAVAAADAATSPGDAGEGVVTPIAGARRARPRVLGALAAAAAVVLVLVVGASVVGLGDGEDASQQATDAPSTDDSAAGEAGDADGGAVDEAASSVPDLGEADDLDAVVAGFATARSSSGEPSDGFDSAEPPDAAAEDESAPLPSTTAPAAPAPSEEGLAATTPAPVPDGADPVAWCRAQVLGEDADEAAAATVRWRGTPAVAFLLAADDGEQVLVVSARTCLTLAGPAPAS